MSVIDTDYSDLDIFKYPSELAKLETVIAELRMAITQIDERIEVRRSAEYCRLFSTNKPKSKEYGGFLLVAELDKDIEYKQLVLDRNNKKTELDKLNVTQTELRRMFRLLEAERIHSGARFYKDIK
jgi:DNA-directed RNA polymerase subunit N (RpoN/RPB10)